MAKDVAGVTMGWTLPGVSTKGWKQVSLDTAAPLKDRGNDIQPRAVVDGLFTWYRVEFELPEARKGEWIPWLARVCASGNGYMWLNGHNIGRHWECGPQRDFFLPECWLNFGEGQKNVLVFGLRQTANGAHLQAIEIRPYEDAAELR